MNEASQFSRRIAIGALSALVGISCTDGANGQRASEATNAVARRERPSSRAMERAFARVQDDVTRCLNAANPTVRVRGAFDGDDGGFAVERITNASGGEVPFAVSTCVRAIVERARVRPFRAESVPMERDFVASSAGSVSASTQSNTTASATSSGAQSNSTTSSGTSAGANTLITSGALRFGTSPADLVRREHDALQRCFEQASEQAPNIEGEVELRFTLDARGRVLQTSHRVAREQHGNGLLALVGQCMEAHVRLIAFGAQADGGGAHIVPIGFGGREHFAPANSSGPTQLPVE